MLELVEQQLDQAKEAYSAAVLAEMEAVAALRQAEDTLFRLTRAAAELRGEPIDAGVIKDEEPHKEVPPAPKPKPKGPPCNSCGAAGSMRQQVIEANGKQIQVMVCGECNTQRF